MSEVQKAVLLPRFTAFAGAQSFRSSPFDVRDFAKAELAAWRGGFIGTSVAFTLRLEESVDLLTWHDVANSGLAPAVTSEDTTSCDLEMPWVRVAVELAGTGAAVTCWLVANFTRRDR